MKIAVLPGDGIGTEIIAEALKVLRALQCFGLELEMREAPVGGAGYDAAGDPLPAATLSLAKEADAIFFGAVGGWEYDKLPRPKRPGQAILRLRKELQLFANLRPAVVYAELADASSVKAHVVAGLDLLILRALGGDIHCDEASMLTGSIGMLPSASLDENNKGLYEPIHGSAPDIAGRGIANPLATLLSVAMMLRYSLNRDALPGRVGAAVRKTVAQGFRTGDTHQAGTRKVGTSAMGDAVVAAL